MANKMTVTLDASKLKNLVSKRSYKNREGEEVEVKEIRFELVEVKEESKKVVYNHDKFQLVKTHFAAAIQTKEERDAGEPTQYIGEGVTQVWKNDLPASNVKKGSPAESFMNDDGSELDF